MARFLSKLSAQCRPLLRCNGNVLMSLLPPQPANIEALWWWLVMWWPSVSLAPVSLPGCWGVISSIITFVGMTYGHLWWEYKHTIRLSLSSHQVLHGSLIISHLYLANYWDDNTLSELDQTRCQLFLPSRDEREICHPRQPCLISHPVPAFPPEYYKQYSKMQHKTRPRGLKTILRNLQQQTSVNRKTPDEERIWIIILLTFHRE